MSDQPARTSNKIAAMPFSASASSTIRPNARDLNFWTIVRTRSMTIPTSTTGWVVALVVLILLVSGLLLFRALVLHNALVIGDEYRYRSESTPGLSRALLFEPHQLNPKPNLIYLTIMQLSGLFGPAATYGLAKIMNWLAFMGSAIPIFFVARAVTGSARRGLAVAIVSLLLPDGLFIAYYMPEAFYRLGFWLVVAIFVLMPRRDGMARAIVLGLSIAVLFYIKPHALMVLVAVGIGESLLLLRSGKRRLVRSFSFGGVFLLTFVAAVVLIQLALADHPSFNVLGEYKPIAENILGLHSTVSPDYVRTWMRWLGWNLLAVVAISGFGLFVVAQRAWRATDRQVLASPQKSGFYVFIVVYAFLVLMAISKTTTDANEGFRLHFRYYDCVFPAFLIVLLDPAWRPTSLMTRAIGAATWVGAAFVLLFFARKLYPGFEYAYLADAPALAIIHAPAWVRAGLILLVIWVAVAYLELSSRRGVYAGVLLGASLIVSQVESARLTIRDDQRIPSAAAYRMLASLAGDGSLGAGTIVARNGGEAFSLLFHIAAAPRLVIRSTESPVDLADFQQGQWVFLASPLYQLREQKLVVFGSQYGTFVPLSKAAVEAVQA